MAVSLRITVDLQMFAIETEYIPTYKFKSEQKKIAYKIFIHNTYFSVHQVLHESANIITLNLHDIVTH